MKEIDRYQLIEDIWTFIVTIVLKKVYGKYKDGDVIYELENRKYIDKFVEEEFLKAKSCFADICAYWIGKNSIKSYLMSIGLMRSSYYIESLENENLYTLVEELEEDGYFINEVYLKKCKDENCDIEIAETLYLVEASLDSSYRIEDLIGYVGGEFIYFDYLEESLENSEILGGDMECIEGDFEKLFSIQNSTRSNKLKRMITWFIISIIKMEYADAEPLIIYNGKKIKRIMFFKKNYEEDYFEDDTSDEQEELIIRELSNAVYVMILSEILLKEIKKEGYSL